VSLYLGGPGSGKTTRLASDLAKIRGPLLLWDPNNEHGKVETDYSGDTRGFLARVRGKGKAPRRARLWGSEADFRALSRYAFLLGRLTLAVDEAHLFVPRSGDARHPFRALVLQCRHRQVAILACAWRPVDLPRYLTAAGGSAFVHRTTERLDLEFWRHQAGDAFAARLPTLKVGQALVHKR
jgi:hypothetical protein